MPRADNPGPLILFPIAFTNNNNDRNMSRERLISTSSGECQGGVYNTVCRISFVNDHFLLPIERLAHTIVCHNFFY